MDWELIEEGSALRIRFGEVLTIVEISEFQNAVMPVLSGKRSLMLDLSRLMEMDTAGLQWLVFLMHWCSARNVHCKWERLSPVVADLVSLYRVADTLGIPLGEALEA